MRDSLRQSVELLIANDEVMRKAARRSFPEMSRLASLVMTMHGRTADAASIRACRKLVKTRCCLTSLFRGLLEPVVVARMSMADDAVAYFEEVSAVFETLRKGTRLAYPAQLVSAMAICDQCPPARRDEAARRTVRAYDEARAGRVFPIGSDDIPFVCLSVIAGRSVARLVAEAGRCHELAEVPSVASYALALSDRPAQEKADSYWLLHLALKDRGCAASDSHLRAMLCPFVDLEVPVAQLVDEVCEVDDVLGGTKGHLLSSGVRHAMAAALVLSDHAGDLRLAPPGASALGEATPGQAIEALATTVLVAAKQASSTDHS